MEDIGENATGTGLCAVLWQGHELSDVATAAVLSFNQLFRSCQQQFGCGAILTAVLTQIAAP